ncbi:DUF5610 domain-containing protein [Paraglaciecola aestuariivivens]
MNISQLKAFLGDKPQHLGNDNSLQNQLRDAGLSQVLATPVAKGLAGEDKFSTSTTLGVRVFAASFNQSLEIDQRKPNFSVPKEKEQNSTLFDFEEVAKNVLNFVGGAIKNAKHNGANEGQLNALFAQATSGVMKGIKMAERDLAGFLNEDITQGIEQSKNLIETGIEKLRQDIFAPNKVVAEQQINLEQTKIQKGELSIRTRDGDKVTLSFEDLQHFEFNQRQLEVSQPVTTQASVNGEQNSPSPEDKATEVQAGTINESVPQSEEQASISPEDKTATQTTTQENAVFIQQNAFSFSVKGELDESELKAIGQLVVDTNELAEEFFNGDIETAFNQALELGFDQQELASFALQLTKVENTQVIKTYETVSHYDQDNQQADPAKAVKPVTEYLDKLLNVLDGARLKLENNQSYENVVNELINRLGDEVATPDLISAINRFNEFNQRLVNSLPIGYQPSAKEA